MIVSAHGYNRACTTNVLHADLLHVSSDAFLAALSSHACQHAMLCKLHTIITVVKHTHELNDRELPL